MSIPDDRETADAMARDRAEPLLRVEKQLILGSLLIGLVLLGLLWWVSAKYFPAADAAHPTYTPPASPK